MVLSPFFLFSVLLSLLNFVKFSEAVSHTHTFVSSLLHWIFLNPVHFDCSWEEVLISFRFFSDFLANRLRFARPDKIALSHKEHNHHSTRDTQHRKSDNRHGEVTRLDV